MGDDPVSDAKKYCRCMEKAEQETVKNVPECFKIYNEVQEKYKEQKKKLKIVNRRMEKCSQW